MAAEEKLIDVRCPLPSKGRPSKQCNKLCVRVSPGSTGEAYCPRHEQVFAFQVDDSRAFNAIMHHREAVESDQIASRASE